MADPAQTGGRGRGDDDGEDVLDPAATAVGCPGALVVGEGVQGNVPPAQGDRWPEGEDERPEDELPAAEKFGCGRDVFGNRAEFDPKVLAANPELWQLLGEGARRSRETGALVSGWPEVEAMSARYGTDA
ncbi:hypothetical protein ACFT9I_01605 [Streptomyces sp. NPDC057137]|uniref:hypothetical protein n=1 Tax=Streptomyces sp. NPDC057137 TaxID=3346030 RepID=UPI00362DC6F7